MQFTALRKWKSFLFLSPSYFWILDLRPTPCTRQNLLIPPLSAPAHSPPPPPTLFDQSLSGGKKKGKQHFRYLKLPRRVDTSLWTVARDPDLQIRRGGGAVSKKFLFRLFGPPFVVKISGRRARRAPLLGPLLVKEVRMVVENLS